MRLGDRVAVITGGGSGIGEATALLFAREGAHVVVGDISEEAGAGVVDRIAAGGGQALFVRTDVSDVRQIDHLFDRTIETFAGVDVLVNNAYGSAGVTLKGDGDLLDVDEETWDRVMGTTLKSVFYATRRGVREMLTRGGGAVVNMSSVNGLFAYGLVGYSTAKGGIIALTRCASVQYADRGIRINVICPGTIETGTTGPYFDQVPGLREQTNALYPRGSIGRPAEVASMALYLASDESSFVNGAVFVVDGGLTAGAVRFGLAEEVRGGLFPDSRGRRLGS
jgi:NAD(P)-dependent dehydrogenase (short-subunit alcohol dehydrogenase family)